MANQLTSHEITERISMLNRRLSETGAEPSNADRALWGAWALVGFADATGQRQDVQADPETVLSDLLCDLMHWCDDQKTSGGLEESIDFESALDRARNYYNEECADEKEQLRAERG